MYSCDPGYELNGTTYIRCRNGNWTEDNPPHCQLGSARINALILIRLSIYIGCLQCFDAVGWAAGKGIRPVKTEWWSTGVVIDR